MEALTAVIVIVGVVLGAAVALFIMFYGPNMKEWDDSKKD